MTDNFESAMWEWIGPWLDGKGFGIFGDRMMVERHGQRAVICVHVRELVYRRDNGTCRYCHLHRPPFAIDHIVPWSAGGSDRTPNLQLLCEECNMLKGNREPLTPTRPPIVTACGFCNPSVENGDLRVWCARCSEFASVTEGHAYLVNRWLTGHCEIGSWNDTSVWSPGKRPPARVINDWLGVVYAEIDDRLAAWPVELEADSYAAVAVFQERVAQLEAKVARDEAWRARRDAGGR